LNKRDLVIVALATFCLTSTLFMILPSRSTERDPWADVSGPIVGESDGIINMRDIQYEITHFNQDVSNMTRNVNVTNLPITIQTMPATNSGRYVWVNPLPGVSNGYHLMPVFETRGFKKIYFSLTGRCNLTIGWRVQGAFNESGSWWSQIDHNEEIETTILQLAWREFDIKGETLVIWLGDTFSNSYEISYYMTA